MGFSNGAPGGTTVYIYIRVIHGLWSWDYIGIFGEDLEQMYELFPSVLPYWAFATLSCEVPVVNTGQGRPWL